jgi:hypothetical protein
MEDPTDLSFACSWSLALAHANSSRFAAMIDSQNYQISRESLTDRLTSVYSELASTGAASGMKSRPFVRHSLRRKLSDR